MILLIIKYRIKFWWGEFMELCGYCRYCGMKKATTNRRRTICINIRCRS